MDLISHCGVLFVLSKVNHDANRAQSSSEGAGFVCVCVWGSVKKQKKTRVHLCVTFCLICVSCFRPNYYL